MAKINVTGAGCWPLFKKPSMAFIDLHLMQRQEKAHRFCHGLLNNKPTRKTEGKNLVRPGTTEIKLFCCHTTNVKLQQYFDALF